MLNMCQISSLMAAAEGLVAEFSSFANLEEKKRRSNLLMSFPKTGNQMGSFGQIRKNSFFRFCRPILDIFGLTLLIFGLNVLNRVLENRNSVLNRVGKSAIFVLNRVRVWGAAPHLPTQGYIEYPPGSTLHTFTKTQKWLYLLLYQVVFSVYLNFAPKS